MAYTDIDKPDLYFNTKLYTGNGSTQSITGVNFQPDLVWIKKRSATSDHMWHDIARGVTNAIRSNTTGAENSQSNYLTAFDSDGFTVGSSNDVNTNGSTFASWNWLASNTTASNTAGDINSTVSVNTTSGFSIVSYTGTGATATIGHGLGSAPKMIIIKQRNTIRNWVVGHDGIGWTKYLYFDSNQASNTGNFFNNTDPSSTVFDVVNDGGVNASGGTYIAYCFAEKKGFSKFGSYTGNGSTDGTFVYTGFKPAFVIVKRTNTGANWVLQDNKRDTYNYIYKTLNSNQNYAEFDSSAYNRFDFLSNGFKLRGGSSGSGTDTNGSGDTYIYMAFAENPFVTSTGIPTTAR